MVVQQRAATTNGAARVAGESTETKEKEQTVTPEETKEESESTAPNGDALVTRCRESTQPTLENDGKGVENQPPAGDSLERSDFEEWRQQEGETIFEPLMEELQHPQWNNNLETLVFDQNFPIVGEAAPVAPLPTRKRTRKLPKPLSEKFDGWNRPGSGILKRFVPIKCSEMKRLWNSSPSGLDVPSQLDVQVAKKCMNKVHSCMQDLRVCFTFSAAEKNCLNLSVALLDLAATPCCKDPFMCLQQASMYATQAPKAGNSDMSFRRSIPTVNECSPRNALAILGRADCMHAVFFPEEAAFLCSFVARACALHRDPSPVYEWNDQWKVVGMHAYNVSVMIRATVNSMTKQTRPKNFSKMWEPDVIKELELGCKDAKELLKSSSQQSGTTMELEADDEEEDAEREEDSDTDEEDAAFRNMQDGNCGIETVPTQQNQIEEEDPIVVYGV